MANKKLTKTYNEMLEWIEQFKDHNIESEKLIEFEPKLEPEPELELELEPEPEPEPEPELDLESDKHNAGSNKKYIILPWIEKFRPATLDNLISQDDIVLSLKQFIKNKQLPHLLFYGAPGTGKTSAILACARALYKQNYKLMVLEINASEERGIEVIRNKIKNFIMTKGVFIDNNSVLFKLVILDEADSMTPDAQAMLRSVIERHTENVRFCLICNFSKKIIPAIQSRCTPFKFVPLANEIIIKRIKEICKEMNVKITKDGYNTLMKVSKGDMRKVINILQSTNMIYDKINSINISRCLGYPTKKDISDIYNAIQTEPIKKSYNLVKNIIIENSYSLFDIIAELTELILDDFINNNKFSNIILNKLLFNLKNIEINLTASANDNLQIAGLVGLFKL